MIVPQPDTNLMLKGDCIDWMKELPNESIDMVLCDLPYGTTQNRWDEVVPFDKLWEQYNRIIKEDGIIVLTASQPFSSMLLMSNREMFKHEWIWIKNKGSNFANTVREPFKEHEHVLIFANKKWTYNKQMQERTGSGLARVKYDFMNETKSDNYRKFERKGRRTVPKLRVPASIQKFNTEQGLHPTQKPVALMEYLIKTYTNEGDLVLDNCMGSGTAGVACKNLNRDFIGIELDEKYFKIAKERIENTTSFHGKVKA